MRSLLTLGVVTCLLVGCSAGDAQNGNAVAITSDSSSETELSSVRDVTSSIPSDRSSGAGINWDFSAGTSEGEFVSPPSPPPPIVQENDPCGIVNCDEGRGCCHNPLAMEPNSFPREFLVDCFQEPRGQANAPMDPTCADYRCETLYCLWKGCRLDSGQCGVWADEYLAPGGGDVLGKIVEIDFGCVDERWLIRRNESGVPPDPTLECAAEYWWPDAGTPGNSSDAAAAPGTTSNSSSAEASASGPSGDAGSSVAVDASL